MKNGCRYAIIEGESIWEDVTMPERLIIILLAVLGNLYALALSLVEYRSAGNPTPQNVADVYDAESYQKWKRYSAEHCRLTLASTAVICITTVVFLCTDLYAAFAALFPTGFFWQLFAVILLESVVGTVIEVVRNYVAIMVIEQKYGFNRSTMKTFVFDRIRGFLLSTGLSLLLAQLMSVFHRAMGDWLIVAFTAAIFCFSLLISFLYPVFSRIGNKFVPLEDGELKEQLMALLTKHGYQVKAIEVMDASRRTTKLNAYFTGFGKMKRIVLYDNLVNAMSAEEICAVFAHELGHGLHKDVLKQQIMNIGNLFLMALVVWVAVREPRFYTAFGFEQVNYGFAYILVGIGLGLVQPLTGLVMNAYSRVAEYRADRQAVKEGYGAAMITALKKLARDNFAHLAPSRINVVLEYSHPPLSERIAAVEKLLDETESKEEE